MKNQAMSARRDRGGSEKSWDVGNDLRWRRGFSDIGPSGLSRGSVGSSGMLAPSPRKNRRSDDDDTLSH
jgi:hypothetical protein